MTTTLTAPETAAARAHRVWQIALHDGSSRDAVAAAAAELLAEKRKLETPAQTVERLEGEAKGHDARATRMLGLAAEFFGKAAGRERQGEIRLAADFQEQAEAYDKSAVDAMKEALDLRLQASLIKVRADNAEALREIAR